MSARTPAEISHTRYRAVSDPVRRRLLRILEDSAGPRDVETLAAAVELHPNTVRGHLEVLEQAGLVSRATERRVTPGRPRVVFSAVADPERATPGGYRLLAEMLTTSLRRGSEDPSAAAERAGWEWGRYLAESLPPSLPLSPDQVMDRFTTLLADFGFDPRSSHDDSSTTVELRDCPFRDLARDHADVVCSLHMGLLRGSADAMGGSMVVESLQPFAEPSLCRAVLRPA